MAAMSGDSVDKKEKERNDIDKLCKKVSRFFYIPGYSADVVDFPSDDDSSSKPERDKQTESPERDISCRDVPGEIDSGKKRKSESEKQTDRLFKNLSRYFYIPGYSADVVDFPSDEGSSSESEEKKQTASPATDTIRDVQGDIDPRKSSEKIPTAGRVESQYHEHEDDVTEDDVIQDADKPGQSSDFKAYSKSLQGPGPVDIDKLKVSFRERGKKPKLVFDLQRKSQYQHGDVSHGDADKTTESSSVAKKPKLMFGVQRKSQYQHGDVSHGDTDKTIKFSSVSSTETVKTPEQEFDKVLHGTGVGVLATGDLVICDYKRGFVVYTPQGEYITSHRLPGIHDVAGTPDGGMVAVSANTLYRLNKQWKELWTVDIRKLSNCILGGIRKSDDHINGGVCVDRQGVIYMRLYHTVCMVGDDGTIFKHIHHHVPGAVYDRPWFSGIAVQPWGDILLTHPDNHCIVILSASDEPESKLKGPFHFPCGVAVDADGIVAVTDSNANTVTVYSPTGQYMESWGKFGAEPGKFKGPTGIAFSPSGDLIVCDSENHRVQIF